MSDQDLAREWTAQATKASAAVFGVDDEVGNEEADLTHSDAARMYYNARDLEGVRAHTLSSTAHMEAMSAAQSVSGSQHAVVVRLHGEAATAHELLGNTDLAAIHRELAKLHEDAVEQYA